MYHEKYESLLHSEGNLYFLFYFYLILLKTTKIFSFCQRLGKLFIANIYRNGTIMYCMFSIFNTKINSFSKVFCISNKSFMLLCKTNNNTILVTKFKQIGYEGHLPNFRAGHGKIFLSCDYSDNATKWPLFSGHETGDNLKQIVRLSPQMSRLLNFDTD